MPCLKCREKEVADFITMVPKKFLWFSWEGYQKNALCREHLLVEYRKSFTTSQARLVVFYPDFENKTEGFYQYLPVPLSEFKNFYEENDSTFLKETFQKIRGVCEKCEKPSQVAYFGTGSFGWEQKPFTSCTTSDQIVFSSILTQPEILCMQCCYLKVEPSISACDLKRIGALHVIPKYGDYCLIGVEE